MESNAETSNEKKCINKAKSCNVPSLKVKSEPPKRKSFNSNEAVRSVDLALGRLKKSKLVDGEYTSYTRHVSPVRHVLPSAHMFIDSLTEPNHYRDADCSSSMSMNFSHYELMRNLSRPNCSMDGAYSSTTCNAYMSASDILLKNEHLERYFRSAEMNREFINHDPGTGEIQLEVPDK